MPTYIDDLVTLSKHLTELRNLLGMKPFCLNDEEEPLPGVAKLLSKLSTEDNSILDRVNLLLKNSYKLEEAEGSKQYGLLKNETFTTIKETIKAEIEKKPLFKDPSSDRASNQSLVDFLNLDLKALKSKLEDQPQNKIKSQL